MARRLFTGAPPVRFSDLGNDRRSRIKPLLRPWRAS